MVINFEEKEKEAKKNELIEVIFLYPKEDLTPQIEKLLEKEEKIIKKYTYIPGIAVKLYPEKIEKIKKLYPEIIIEENLTYNIYR
jgi:hypothetical protein